MTRAAKFFLARLGEYLAQNPQRRADFTRYLRRETGRAMHYARISEYVQQKSEPRLSVAIAMMRYLQLAGVIVPADKKTGLFVYVRPDQTPPKKRKAAQSAKA